MNKLISLIVFLPAICFASNNGSSLYSKNCASCHGSDRLGVTGPPLIPSNYGRGMKAKQLSTIIAKGRLSTQMPGFEAILSKKEIAKLTKYITSPAKASDLVWTEERTKKSYRKFVGFDLKPSLDKKIDPLNLFTVVEVADHHFSILDGDALKVLKRIETKRGVHGGAKYSPDGRYMYLSSRDGWVQKFDMQRLEKVAEIRVAINTRNIAVSSDGKFVLAGNFLPHSLVLLDGKTLKLVKTISVDNGKGDSSRVSAVYNAPPRKSFVIALKDLPEVWELSYKKDPTKQKVRRIALKEKVENFSFNQSYSTLMGTAHRNTKGQVIDLDKAKKVSELEIEGMPHLGAGITFNYKGERVMAAPNIKKALLSVVRMSDWKTIKSIKTKGPGFFLRSHESTPYAWTDVFWGPNKDLIHIVDKRSLKIIKTLKPEPGKTAAHIEFDRHGRYALVSIWENDGALVVYDAKTFKELKRIPMKKPSGKYNVFNKINYSEGTSH